MRRVSVGVLLVTVFVFAVVGTGAGAPVAPPQRSDDLFVADEVLVKFQPGVEPGSVARSVGARLADRIEALDVHVLKVPASAVESVVLALSHNSLVEYAEPNFIAQTQLNPNDPYDDSTCYNTPYSGCMKQWAWKKIKAYDAWGLETGDSVKIAVVDTGIASVHQDLPAVFAQRNFINNSQNANDDNGHGTHVAGTIGALTNNARGVAGANWSVRLLAAKVLDANGSGPYSAVANGIIWAADNGAKVINLSLGGTSPSTTLQNAVNYAWNKGVVLACAAGNFGKDKPLYPARYEKCVAVAATKDNDARAGFSSYGTWVDVAAPGVNILSTIPLSIGEGVYAYDAWSGTSMATPHVAGLAGLIWATGQCGGNGCVRKRIEERADPISGTGSLWKWGRINYYRSVKP